MSLKTPKYNLKLFPNVYEPSEDTFLLLDALEADIDNIVQRKPNFIIEIGSGSGIVITALAGFLKNVMCFATDINPEACLTTKHTSNINDTYVEVCNMNLLTCFRECLFDVIVFNPPYVVTNPSEISGNGIARAWAGGENGREIIDQFLKLLPKIFHSRSVCYMIVIKENNPEAIMEVINSMDFHVIVLKERRIPCEHLYVLKIYR